MNEHQPEQAKSNAQREARDNATSERLAKLALNEPDVSRLEERLAEAMEDHAHEEPAVADETPPSRIAYWLRPAAGIAAVLAMVLTLLVVTGTNPPTASASVVELSQLHNHIMSGRVPLTPVNSISEANASIASQLAHGPALPSDLAEARVQSCCLANVQGDLVALALLRDDDTTATLVIAQAPNFAHQMGTIIEIDGRTFFGHELNGIHMMMANDGDRWLCVMGDTTYYELARIAADVRFAHE